MKRILKWAAGIFVVLTAIAAVIGLEVAAMLIAAQRVTAALEYIGLAMSAESGVAANNRNTREYIGTPPNAMELARVEVTAKLQ